MIRIQFEPASNFEVVIYLNGKQIPHIIMDNEIVIEHSAVYGINHITVELISSSESMIKLTGLSYDNVSTRHTFYLAYSVIDGKKKSNTWLDQNNKSIIIPFGNPISWWLGECASKIPNSLYGTNLYEEFEIFIPSVLEIDSTYPKLIQDFMKHNFDFHVFPKTTKKLHNKDIPWLKINLEYDEEELLDEFQKNIDKLNGDAPQNKYTRDDNSELDLWQVSFAMDTTDSLNLNYDPETFPCLVGLLKKIQSQGIDIIHAFVGTVKAHSVVMPHSDDFYKHDERYADTSGCSQFFIPIGWKQGNYFKFNGVGFIPWQDGAFIVNNSDFLHGSVNTSDSTRFTIGIYCNFTEENIRNLEHGN